MRRRSVTEFITTGEAGREAGLSIQAVISWCKKHPELVAGRLGGARVLWAKEWRELMRGRVIPKGYNGLKVTESRQEAKEQGIAFFISGEPCVNGHMSPRYTSNGQCKACCQIKTKESRDKALAKERDRVWSKLDQSARDEATKLGLEKKYSVLRYASLQRMPHLQIRALRLEAHRRGYPVENS